MPSVVVHPPPFGGQTSPDGLGGDPVEPRRDDGLGAGLVNRACAGIADHHEAWRLEHDHGDGVDRAAAVGDEGAVLNACHGDQTLPKDRLVQIRQLARHVMLRGQPR